MGSNSHKIQNAGQGLSGDLVGVESSQLGHGHSVGEDPNFFLDHGRDLLDLGELSGLVHGEEVIPPFVVPEVQQAVVSQDLLVFEGRGKQKFLIGHQFVGVVLDFPEISFDPLYLFGFEILEDPTDDLGDSNGGGYGVKTFVSAVLVHQAIEGVLFQKFLQDVLVPDLGEVDGDLHSLERGDGGRAEVLRAVGLRLACSIVFWAMWILLGICLRGIRISVWMKDTSVAYCPTGLKTTF